MQICKHKINVTFTMSYRNKHALGMSSNDLLVVYNELFIIAMINMTTKIGYILYIVRLNGLYQSKHDLCKRQIIIQ